MLGGQYSDMMISTGAEEPELLSLFSSTSLASESLHLLINLVKLPIYS